ncbi:MAG: vitamin K epoxide reductase family protein [Rothia sp. (in: high G+C Gram-positive bacteria)]|nr:vitamin K epoxide reductase family protein [Rothia sp. (in: high G+C Gram-positive bacteria)]
MSTPKTTPAADQLEQAKRDYQLGWYTLIPGLLAFGAAAMLVYERLQIYMDAAHKSVCDLNALLNCGTVMRTWQAEAFGFPNPFIGIAGYAIVLAISTALLARASFSRWYWVSMQVGHSLAMAFVLWLWYNTTFEINALCLFCMVVWIMQTIIWVMVSSRNIQAGIIPLPQGARQAASSWAWFSIALILILLFGMIFIRFFDVIMGMF